MLDELRVALPATRRKNCYAKNTFTSTLLHRRQEQIAFAALESFVGGRTAFSGLNFLSPRAGVARDWLTRALNDAGARVDLVHAYRIRSSPELDPGRIAAMFSAAADCIVLVSPASVVQILSRLFDAHDLAEALPKVTVVCLDETTAKAAEKRGRNVRVMAAPGTPAMLVRSIAEGLLA